MNRQVLNFILLIVPATLFFHACKKNKGDAEKIIHISGVAQLYQAVNDPLNAGACLVLAPGTYLLDSTYANAGRIEFGQDMIIQGQPGFPEQVIIDASALPNSSFNPPLGFPAARTGAIRMGKGSNSLEWVTIKGNATAQALSVIDTDLVGGIGDVVVKIAHSTITGGRIGIDIRNAGTASIGRIIDAEITDNNIFDNLVQFGQGIEIQNANGATRAVIRAQLKENYVHGNKVGLRAFNNNANNTRTDSGSITIQSTNDRFEENGIGLNIAAALNQASTTTSNVNMLRLDADRMSIQNNHGMIPPDIADPAPGGLLAYGGNSAGSGIASNNRLLINLSNCSIAGNQGPGIKAYGAFSASLVPAGVNNIVDIQLSGLSKNATVVAIPSFPLEPAGTNKVNIIP